MAGLPLHAPAQRDTATRHAAHRPSTTPDAWRLATPFAHLSAEARLDYLREYGMHGGTPEFRVGPEAFEIRSDIEVGDACETAAQLLRALIGSLEVLAIVPDASVLHKDACAGSIFLARQAAGAIAVIAAGVFPGGPPMHASNDE